MQSPRQNPVRPLVVAAAAAVTVLGLVAFAVTRPATSQTAPASGAQQEVGVLRVDWDDPELKRFKAAPLESTRAVTANTQGADKLAGLRLPVLAFTEVPQLVRNAQGPNAQPTKPRKIITDADAPVWYHLVETYGDISITIDADLRINHAQDAGFQIQKRPLSADGKKQGGKTPISVFDSSTEAGQEGIIVEYTVHKFPDIPYTVAIECRRAAKAQCRDVATVTKDQALLHVISAR